MAVYNVCRNTVSNWVQGGLEPSVVSRPNLFRGDDVEAFHRTRRERSKAQLRPGEFKCMGCKMAVFPRLNLLSSRPSKTGALFLMARCLDCGANVCRLGTQADLDAIRQQSNPNTSEGFSHEENTSVPGGIGISKGKTRSPNDGIIYRWQAYAGKFSGKTLDRHLTTIRQFEAFLGFKPFEQITLSDCHELRDQLKAALLPDASMPKSRSTVQHSVSHLKDFLGWLRKQEGYKRLTADLPDALDLPRSAYAKDLRRDSKLYPSLEEADDLLRRMHAGTMQDLRKRAIFALAFLGALRADTLISLRLRDIDCSDRKITQDARVARTKNGESLVIAWFPIAEAFSSAVVEWIDLMKRGGFNSEDALFPNECVFSGRKKCRKYWGQRVPSMTSTYAVSEAFRAACRNHHTIYTPHAAKHTIAAERDRRTLTAEQRKAWSENMGHENEQITLSHYGKLSADRHFDLMADIGEERDPASLKGLSDDKKIAIFDSFAALVFASR